MHLIKHLFKKYGWRLVFYKKIYKGAKLQNRNFKALLDVSSVFSKEKLNVFTTANEDGILLNIFSKIPSSFAVVNTFNFSFEKTDEIGRAHV